MGDRAVPAKTAPCPRRPRSARGSRTVPAKPRSSAAPHTAQVGSEAPSAPGYQHRGQRAKFYGLRVTDKYDQSRQIAGVGL